MNELRKLMEAIDIAEDSTPTSAFTIGDGNGRFLIKNARVQDKNLMTANPAFVKMWAKRGTAEKQLDKLIELEGNKNWFYYGKAQPSTWHVVEVRISEI